MGKRSKKKKAVVVKRRTMSIPKFFRCPYCDQEDGIKVQISHASRKASLECRKCGISFKDLPITRISEAIDVYDDWMDSVRAANAIYNPADEEVIRERDEDARDENVEWEADNLQRKISDSSDNDDSSIEND